MDASVRGARVAWSIAWLALLAIVIGYLAITWRKYGHADSAAYALFQTRRGWLWAHLAGGATTLLLGPFQFVPRLRAAWPALHRVSGRVYLLALLVACVGAAGLIATTPGGLGLQVAFSATGVVWLFTATRAFVAIRRRQFQVHRRWMIRNYIVTTVFVTFRLSLMIPGVLTLASPQVMIPTLLWLAWLVPMAIYEAYAAVSRRHRFRRDPAPRAGDAPT